MADDESVDVAWKRVEAGLGLVLPASREHLSPPADAAAIDAVEAALGVSLPPDFRRSLTIHNGTGWGTPSPVPLDYLYDTDGLVETTRMWRDNYAADPIFDDPRVWAHQIDRGNLGLSGPVRPIVGATAAVVVGDMNGDVWWFLDLDPPPGGTPGQVVRVDVECASWAVLAPSWTRLLGRYADDLERFATDPAGSTLMIEDGLGPACEWGSVPTDAWRTRPAWLRDVPALDPHG